jgi:hypothetical protein
MHSTLEHELPSQNRKFSKDTLKIILGIIIVVFGVSIGLYGLQGLNTPHSCPAQLPNCTTTAYPFQIASTYGGFSLVILGSAMLLLRGQIRASRVVSFGTIVAIVLFILVLFGNQI